MPFGMHSDGTLQAW